MHWVFFRKRLDIRRPTSIDEKSRTRFISVGRPCFLETPAGPTLSR